MSDHLCEELIVEIFTRLPPKTLLRFRSVSKSLRSCIDSPDFIRMHTFRSPQRLVITHVVRDICTEKYGNDSFCTIYAQDQLPLCGGYIDITALKFPCRSFSITSSCNGIICLFEYVEGILTLWNPSIMCQLTLTDCPWRCMFGIGIGIGIDSITDDTKIVSIPLYGDGNGESTFVYSIKTRDWRPIASLMPLYSGVSSRPCYLNGVLHWVVERCSTNSDDVELNYIMTFDLRTNVFGMIDLPNSFGKPTS